MKESLRDHEEVNLIGVACARTGLRIKMLRIRENR